MLPFTEVKFYPEVKPQVSLSSLWISCKRALNSHDGSWISCYGRGQLFELSF